MEKLAIVGANEFQNKLVIKAKAMGYETHVFAWEDGAVAKDNADYFYPVSITEKKEILKIVKEVDVKGIISIASDIAMPTVNYIANELKLVSNSNYSTEISTNKIKMRRILTINNLPSPKQIEDLDKLNNIQYPVIVKPSDRSGSRGINKVFNYNELLKAIANANEVSFENQSIVEEYIDGTEYSVEFISQKGKHLLLQITEKITTGAPNFVERAHIAPARISKKLEQDIKKVISRSLDVLKIENGASHSELKITPEGEIKIIEIAGRMGGDFIGSDMVPIATKYDYMKNTINLALDIPIDTKVEQNGNIAFVGFIFSEGDKVRFMKLLEAYPEIVEEYSLSANITEVFDSSSRNGYFILNIPNENKLDRVLDILEMGETFYDSI